MTTAAIMASILYNNRKDIDNNADFKKTPLDERETVAPVPL